MSWALAEVGRPGPAGEVLVGGAIEAATGRLLSVAELQAALRAARLAAAGQAGSGPAGDHQERLVASGLADASAAVTDPTASGAAGTLASQVPPPARPHVPASPGGMGGVQRPPAACRWVAVVGAHGGAGTSTVALAVADAAAAAGGPVHLVSLNPPGACGLLGAASVELGATAGGWRTGRRGPRITVDRPVRTPDPAGSWPPTPPGAATDRLLTVVDAESGAARAPQLLGAAAAVLLVCQVSVRGVQHAEQVLGLLPGPDRAGGLPVLLAAVGPARWPGAVRSATGPLLRELRATGLVVAVPPDRRLATLGLTGAELPRPVLRAGGALLALLTPVLPAAAVPGMTRTHAPARPAGRPFSTKDNR